MDYYVKVVKTHKYISMKKIKKFLLRIPSEKKMQQLKEDRKAFIDFMVEQVIQKYSFGNKEDQIFLQLSLERFMVDSVDSYFYMFKSRRKKTSITRIMAKNCTKKILKEVRKKNIIPETVSKTG